MKENKFKLQKKNKFSGKRIAIGVAAILVGGYLVINCNSKKVKEEPILPIETTMIPTSTPVITNGLEFEPGTHVVLVHEVYGANTMFNRNNNTLDDYYQKRIDVPNGYEFIDVETYQYDNNNYCFDYYYRNITNVLVTGIWNSELGCYEYSNFGEALDKTFTPKVK